ncbi:hypothetical protein ACHAXH_002583 [Discostella pseudostelligera]
MSLLTAHLKGSRRTQLLSRQFSTKSAAIRSSKQSGRRPGGEKIVRKVTVDGDDRDRALGRKATTTEVTDENDGNRTNIPSSPHGSFRKLFISGGVKHAMQTEVDNLPLPATLASICIALSSSIDVLDAYADAEYDLQNDDDFIKSFEIMGSHLQDLSLSSPTQRREKRKSQFQGACRSLVASGNNTMLETWDDVQQSLSAVFNFSVLDIVELSDDEIPPRQPDFQSATSPKRGVGKAKSVPKSAQRHSQSMKSRLSMVVKAVVPSFLKIDDYTEQIKRKIGIEKYELMYRGLYLESNPPISTYDDEMAKLEEKIKQKESQRRSTLREAEILAAKEKADKEKEAKESAMKLLRPLTAEEQKIVTKATRGIGPPSEILASQDADSVQRSSMQTLNPGQWLNDEIINYFLKNCLAKRDEKLCAKQPGRKRSHFFNSFFVQTMFDDKNNNRALRGKYNYKNVKRWSKKVPGKDIFKLKYILCPINLDNMHWTSAVIFMEEKRIQYYDSLGGTDMLKLEGLLQYVKDEFKAKNDGKEMDATEWELVGCTRDTPRQRNGFDCGVFTCMFCDFISKDCPLVFNQEHIDQCRDRIALSIMKNCAIE